METELEREGMQNWLIYKGKIYTLYVGFLSSFIMLSIGFTDLY